MNLKEEIFLDMKAIVPDSNPNTRHFLTKKILLKIEKIVDEEIKKNRKLLKDEHGKDKVFVEHDKENICYVCTDLILKELKERFNN